jgi:hypothetical protein
MAKLVFGMNQSLSSNNRRGLALWFLSINENAITSRRACVLRCPLCQPFSKLRQRMRQLHRLDAVHCKACGQVLNIPDEGTVL